MDTLAFDLDGVIERERRLPKWFPLVLVRLVALLTRSVPEARGVLRRLAKRNNRIIIVTARPSWAEWETRLWLRLHRIPYHALYLVELGGDKLTVLRQEQAAFYFDDDAQKVEALKSQGINAYLFEDWFSVAKLLGVSLGIGFAQRLISQSAPGRWLEKRLTRWVASSPESIRLRVLVQLTNELEEVVWVGKEWVEVYRLLSPLQVFHITSKWALSKISSLGLRPSRDYTAYVGQGKGPKVASVIFAVLSLEQAKRFRLMCSWPFSLLFSFRTEKKARILRLFVPEGHRIGFTSWNEAVVLDSIQPERIKEI